MATSPQEQDLILQIQQAWNKNFKRAGSLIQRFDGVWHYSVTLSETHAIAWGPSKNLKIYSEGCLKIHKIDRKYTETKWVQHLCKCEIFENILASVFAFHYKWKYGVQGWNCEHWARLVTTGHPISYQVKESGFGIFDLFGVLHDRQEAIEQLNRYKK